MLTACCCVLPPPVHPSGRGAHRRFGSRCQLAECRPCRTSRKANVRTCSTPTPESSRNRRAPRTDVACHASRVGPPAVPGRCRVLGNNLCRRACPSLGTNRTYPVRYDKDHTFSVTILKCPAKQHVCIKLEWETLTCAGQFGHDGARCAFCDVRGAASGSGQYESN